MTLDYMFLALCLVLIQIPGFLTKPSDIDGYGDEQEWSGEMRREMNSYDSPETKLTGLDSDHKVFGKMRKPRWFFCQICGRRFLSNIERVSHISKTHRKPKKPKKGMAKTRQGQLLHQLDQDPSCDSTLTEDIKDMIVDAIYNYDNRRTQDHFS